MIRNFLGVRILELLVLLVLLVLLRFPKSQHIAHFIKARSTPDDPAGRLDRSASECLPARRFVG
jgi:hypothetical protein